MSRYQHEIRREVVSRKISYLLHFTPSQNALSILSHGLLSRHFMATRGIPFVGTDPMRLDKHLQAVSVSIHSINESMFAAKRRQIVGEWLIFVLDASILWTLDCRFCWQNAASNEIRHHRGFIGGPWAFKKMFEDRAMSALDPRSSRVTLGRLDSEPTDNAAEVQILEAVAPDLIQVVVAPTHRLKRQLEGMMPSINRVRPVEVMEEFFR